MKSLIPDQVTDTGNYWCTWRTQSTVIGNKKLKKVHTDSIRDAMCEEFLFGEVGVLEHIDPAIRGDLIVVLDDGWDVPYGLFPSPANGGNEAYHQFGSLVLNEERFPSFRGKPEEKLRALNDRVKSLGYAGIGLWIAVQVPFCNTMHLTADEARGYWEERLKWCVYADVKYWKLDWGGRCHDMEYRKMLFDCAKKYAPELKIEQAYTQPTFDVRFNEHETAAYEKRLEEIGFYLEHGDYFRVYDASPEFRYTTTLLRTIETFLSVKHDYVKAVSIPNVEDCVYIAAALGVTFGAMRHYYYEKNPEYHFAQSCKTPMTELKRAVMWQRIAPPFPINASFFEINYEKYTDSYQYPHIEGNPWPYKSDQLVVQDCYAGMSRNMPLPKIANASYDEKPCVVSSVNPYTKALSVFVVPRTIGGSIQNSILADITVEGTDSRYPVGIFGKYKSLTIHFSDSVEKKRICAQDLATECSVDITDLVERKGYTLKIAGEVIERIGLTVKECETEMPGLMVVIK